MTAPAVLSYEDIKAGCEHARERTRTLRRELPMVRLYHNKADGTPGLYLRGDLADNMAGSLPRKRNNFGDTGTIDIRPDHYLARWLIRIPNDPEAKKNVVLRVEHLGGAMQWCGILDHWKAIRRNGILMLRVTFIHDAQYMRWLLCPPNPWLPIWLFQWPRVLPLLGPSNWIICVLIWLNLARVQGFSGPPPVDPFADDGGAMVPGWTSWQVIIKAPGLPFDDSSTWNLLAVRMDQADTVIQDPLDDAEQVFCCRRIFTDDGDVCPIPGVTCANGALVIWIEDQSGYYGPDGTATGGGLAGGFTRTIQSFAQGFVEDIQTLTQDPTSYPPEYYDDRYEGPGRPAFPWVVVRDSEHSAVTTSEFCWGPSKMPGAVVGGDNPIADQLAQLTIESVGALLGYFFLGGFSGLGSIAATVIMPFLVGTILAWLQWYNTGRANNLGWVHLFEKYGQGAEQNAWSLGGVAALRNVYRSTESEFSHVFAIGSAGRFLPWIHYPLGGRIGSTYEEFSDAIWVQPVEEINLSWDWTQDQPPEYETKVGDAKAAQSQQDRMWKLMSKSLATLQNIGVHLIS